MSPGKMAAQAGHAFLDAYRVCQEDDPERAEKYCSVGHGTKVVLQGENEFSVWEAAWACKDAKIPFAEVYDSGHVMPPHFDGSRIMTAVGIGPATRAEVHAIVKKFPLVN